MELRVKVSELYERVKEMYDDGMDYVDIRLNPEDDSDSDSPLPACIMFDAISNDDPVCGVNYEEVEGVEVND